MDDLTVRTGKCLDQRILTDVEYDEEIRAAAKKAGVQVAQKPGEALEALGFSKRGLGDELQSKPGTGEKGKHDPVVSDHNHPTRMSLVPWIHAACALHMARINMLAHDRSCLISIGACNLGHSGFGGSAFVKCSLGHSGFGDNAFVKSGSGQFRPGVRGCEVGICVTVSAMVDVRALSRRMVKALRHAPVGEGGWLPVSWLATTYGCSEAEILAAAGPEGSPGKTRFVTADLGGTTRVKALQGHSSATGVQFRNYILEQITSISLKRTGPTTCRT